MATFFSNCVGVEKLATVYRKPLVGVLDGCICWISVIVTVWKYPHVAVNVMQLCLGRVLETCILV